MVDGRADYVDSKIGNFDLDSSLADYEGQLVADLEKMRSPGEPPVDMRQLWGDAVPAWLKARERSIKLRPGWWSGLPVMPNGLWVLNAARGIGFDCRVLTVGPESNSRAWAEKVDWCYAHLQDPTSPGRNVNITITRDKSQVYGLFLYDDYPPYLEEWLKNRPRGIAIMPLNEHNDWYHHSRLFRYDGNNKQQVVDLLKKIYHRAPGKEVRVGA